MEIVRGWKEFRRAGSFIIERYLKKCSIWIGSGEQGEEVFEVLGLNQPIDEIIPRFALPKYVVAVLLPFKGRIIYDGILRHHSISLGGGFRAGRHATGTTARLNFKKKNTFLAGHEELAGLNCFSLRRFSGAPADRHDGSAAPKVVRFAETKGSDRFLGASDRGPEWAGDHSPWPEPWDSKSSFQRSIGKILDGDRNLTYDPSNDHL